jgi:hypothetical protein
MDLKKRIFAMHSSSQNGVPFVSPPNRTMGENRRYFPLADHRTRTQKTASMNPSGVYFEYGDFPCLRPGNGSDRSDAKPPRLLSDYGD